MAELVHLNGRTLGCASDVLWLDGMWLISVPGTLVLFSFPVAGSLSLSSLYRELPRYW